MRSRVQQTQRVGRVFQRDRGSANLGAEVLELHLDGDQVPRLPPQPVRQQYRPLARTTLSRNASPTEPTVTPWHLGLRVKLDHRPQHSDDVARVERTALVKVIVRDIPG